ncbi:hypothetical protein RM553_18925 [Zunongwangia sp. F363]|uniref:Uncharacterized protein n=1 Tax=Autumnicola tepida TaxID=3075595 RepID=A0ABU3CEY5_9FLAO|nr:hypothetical protein [Zunongwangia sp. F363]MDT0644919.1 hypothetical protein [Zunongwangia sp. F363]
MATDKRYEILKGLPPYGPMYIPISAENEPFYSEGYVVKFRKFNGEKWVANFRYGWTDYTNIFDFPEHTSIIVIAGGQGYIMNPDEKKPKMTFGLTINEVIQKEDGSLICSDGIHILFFDNKSGEYWRSGRISWDGIKELSLTGNKLKGQSYDPTNENQHWSPFELDMKTKELKGGSFQYFFERNEHLEVQQNGLLREKPKSNKKPWWKIW